MQVNKGPREDMLTTLKDKINDSFVAGVGVIEFFNTLDIGICELSFDDMDIITTASDNATLRFKCIDGSYVLKGTSTGTGTVSSFKIKGTDSIEGPDEYIITGTVGSLASNADLKYNITSWKVGTYVTITNFSIVLPNGT